MKLSLLALVEPSRGFVTILAVAGFIIVITIYLIIFVTRFRKVGPNQVLIVFGRQHISVGPDGTTRRSGFRVVKGGGTFVFPFIEKAAVLPLEMFSIEIKIRGAYTLNDVRVDVDGSAQVKILSDDTSILRAAEQLLGKSNDELKGVAAQTIENQLRAIIGTMDIDGVRENTVAFARSVQDAASESMAVFGMGITSLTIRHIGNT